MCFPNLEMLDHEFRIPVFSRREITCAVDLSRWKRHVEEVSASGSLVVFGRVSLCIRRLIWNKGCVAVRRSGDLQRVFVRRWLL